MTRAAAATVPVHLAIRKNMGRFLSPRVGFELAPAAKASVDRARSRAKISRSGAAASFSKGANSEASGASSRASSLGFMMSLRRAVDDIVGALAECLPKCLPGPREFRANGDFGAALMCGDNGDGISVEIT